jgi:hypothetical protein
LTGQEAPKLKVIAFGLNIALNVIKMCIASGAYSLSTSGLIITSGVTFIVVSLWPARDPPGDADSLDPEVQRADPRVEVRDFYETYFNH